MKIIARVESDFPTKFAIPRQSGIVPELKSRIVFEPEYRVREAVRGLEDFSHIWVLWQFSQSVREEWSPTVRPPKLGGNTRVGVFATRSPFRPNNIGLSSVRLEKIEYTHQGPVLHISGADIMDGTPVLDIKPYIAYTDSHPDAVSGFAVAPDDCALKVVVPDEISAKIPCEHMESLIAILKQDPRPGYRADERQYGFLFADMEIFFTVKDGTLTVADAVRKDDKNY